MTAPAPNTSASQPSAPTRPRTASIKSLIVLNGLLIATLTLGLIPWLSYQIEQAVLQQATRHTVSEVQHLNAMLWLDLISPVLIDRSTDPKIRAGFQG